MGRWDVFNRDNGRDTAAGLPRGHPARGIKHRECFGWPRPHRKHLGRVPRKDRSCSAKPCCRKHRERRSQHCDRGRTYSLPWFKDRNDDRPWAVSPFGFSSLAQFEYDGNEIRLKHDLEGLRIQGLIEEKHSSGHVRTPRRLLHPDSAGPSGDQKGHWFLAAKDVLRFR